METEKGEKKVLNMIDELDVLCLQEKSTHAIGEMGNLSLCLQSATISFPARISLFCLGASSGNYRIPFNKLISNLTLKCTWREHLWLARYNTAWM